MRFNKSTPIHVKNQHIDDIVNKRNIIRLDDYINQKTKLRWKCTDCDHVWKTTGTSIIHQGTGCPKCYNERRSDLLIKNKGKAKRQGKKTYFTGKPCKHGHTSARFTTTGECTECSALRHQQWVKDNPDKQRALNIRNKGARRIQSLRRHRDKQNAKPVWFNPQDIHDIYIEATRLTKETGINHHVHHRIPLVGNKNTVRGLHTRDNLIILTEGEHKWYHARPERLKLLW